MKPLRVVITALALLGIAGMAPLASAQDGERVQIALDVTDRHIQQAEQLLAGVDNERAQHELDLAITLQAEAKATFAGCAGNLACLRLTVSQTLAARAHADRAIAIVKGLPDPERVRVQLDRTNEVIERARQVIEECNLERARALLKVGIEMQARAEAAFSEGRFLAALQLTMSARERVLRALRMCRAEENLQERAEQVLQRTQDIITRAQDFVAEHGTDQAREALARAEQLQERAMAEFRQSHFEASIRLSLSARAAAYRAIRLSGGGI